MKRIIAITLILVLLISLPVMANGQLPDVDSENIAQITLKKVATREERSRIIAAGTLGALGAGTFILGFTMDDPDARTALQVSGGVLAVIGGIRYILKGPAEREFEEVMSFPIKDREYAAEDSLDYLAQNARKNRIIQGVSYAGMAIYYLTADENAYSDDADNTYSAIFCAGMAAYSFLNQSYVEKANEKVKRVKAESRDNLQVGFVPGQEQRLVISYNF
ncbi:hypothetical protein [Halothermothrix orenii]|uniref:DUF5683 domain-containing protein n=1 Tax=Halothermothrix orenii (strain H 168 / OCM 544 / DSM 9562) TaxID=373903 RepID=B8CWZ6_HALOH|nr:hypothetical protein [Halothermothrix orenii]ACL69815.1 hypothetical protein Hore_10600 [Halothermothrix orenii H 168]